MNMIRKRARNQFPAVLLTLLSIMQALALELLWEHLQETDNLFEVSWLNLLNLIQISATTLGIILIWFAYASNAMRFRWIPSIGDTVYPFIIGLLEFWQLAMLGYETMGQWLILSAVIFGAMVTVSQITVRRARLSGYNRDFFDRLQPATVKDFIPHAVIVLILITAGIYLWLTAHVGLFALLTSLFVLCLLSWQFATARRFWNLSMSDAD